MTFTIDFDPQTEARLAAEAKREGVDVPTLVRKLVSDNLELAKPPERTGHLTAENDATLALLERWLSEDATDDPEEIRQADAELQKFMRNMNAERKRAGARTLYPEVE